MVCLKPNKRKMDQKYRQTEQTPVIALIFAAKKYS
jgi:hypothetical protein